MKKIVKLITASLVCLVLNQHVAKASSHREAPLISNDPLADNTDLYAFRSPVDTNKIVLIANYIPFEHPAGGPNWYTFGENIRYEIHVKNNAATTGDDIIYRFTFQQVNQDGSTFFNIRLGQQNIKTTYILERSINGGSSFTTIVSNGVVPPPNIGPRSIENATVGLGAANYDALMQSAIATASTGEKVFAGPVDDPFFVDLGGAFDVGNFRLAGKDGLAKFNCHSLVIEVPISTLQKAGKNTTQATSILDGEFVIGVYATASRKAITTFDPTGGKPTVSGNWIQVSRLGMPLTNEAVIPVGQKDAWNATATGNESQFDTYFKNPELALYMDDSQFGTAVPGLSKLRIQSNSLGAFDFRNGKAGLFSLKGSGAVAGTALDDALFGNYLLPNATSPRAVDLLPIFQTGVPNLAPYQLATGKAGNPLASGKPFINNFLPTFGDMLRLNMAVPVTPRNDPKFSSLGLVQAAVLGLTDATYNSSAALQFIPNMDGFPNGRRLEDDVTTIELQAVSGVVLAAIGLWYDDYVPGGSPVTQNLVNVLSFNAGITHNDTTFKTGFPYVQSPWRGFTGAQYSGPVNTPLCGANNSFSLPAIVGPSSVCIGGQITLTNDVSGGTWVSNNNRASINATSGVLTGLSSGSQASISYKVTNAQGCKGVVTKTITVNALPAVPFVNVTPSIGNSNAVCNGKTFQFTGSPSGAWTSSNTAVATISNSGVMNTVGLGAATIKYTVTDANGCTNSRSFNGNVVSCFARGIAPATDTKSEIAVYPNPVHSNSVITIDAKGTLQNAAITIADVYGHQILSKKLINDADLKLSIGSLTPGIYLVTITTATSKKVERLIVE